MQQPVRDPVSNCSSFFQVAEYSACFLQSPASNVNANRGNRCIGAGFQNADFSAFEMPTSMKQPAHAHHLASPSTSESSDENLFDLLSCDSDDHNQCR